MYDLSQHINSTGARVIVVRFPLHDIFGVEVPAVYDWRMHAILIESGLRPIRRRSVLAHEAIHAEYRDHPTKLNHYKLEHRADLFAARNLIDPVALSDLQHCYPDNPEKWCISLRVHEHLLRTYLGQTQK